MTTPHDKALSAFTDYFVRNYPGPDTIIFDPKWHAPKLFNAAMKAIEDADGWQDMSSAPKDGTEIIGRCGPEFPAFSCFYDGARFLHYCNEDGMIAYPVTQWRPFPGPSTPSNEGSTK